MHTRFGLLLLWAGLLPACPADDGSSAGTTGDAGTTSVSTSMSISTTAPTSSTSSTTPVDPSGSSDVTTIEESATGSNTTADTTGATSDSGPESESTGGGAEACMAGCEVELDCGPCAGGKPWKSVEACVDWCTANLMKAGLFSFSCRSGWQGVHACVGALACDGFDQWCAKDPPFAYPCYRADVAQAFECEGQ